MVSYTRLRQYVYQINVELPCSASTIVDELSAIDWTPWHLPDVHNEAKHLPRVNSPVSNSELLKDIGAYFNDPTRYKVDMLTELYRDPDFGVMWAMDYNTLMKNTVCFCDLFKDEPGFTTRIHLDNRQLVTTGMITFSDIDNPDLSTSFFTSENGDSPLRVPIGNGNGWSSAVTHNTWHTGGNFSNETRYSLYFAIALKLGA